MIADLRQLAVGYRRRAVVKSVETLVRTMSTVGRYLPQARADARRVEVIRDVPYVEGAGRANLLDIYRPTETAPPWPVVLYVHGGGFNILSKESHWTMAMSFAKQGYLTFNINYRLAPQHPFPAAVVDAARAYEWLLDHGAAYGGDMSRIVLAGESAGANLVTTLTVASCYERTEGWARALYARDRVPDAVVPACLMHVFAADRYGWRMSLFIRDRVMAAKDDYLRGWKADDDRCQLADPVMVFERGDPPARPLPPFFVFAGEADPIVEDTRRLEAALTKLGVTCEGRYYAGEHHAFHALLWRAGAQQAWRDTHAFLARHLGASDAQ